jgi:hypothetical protein
MSCIARLISGELVRPVVRVRPRLGCECAVVVGVPEAAVNENSPPPRLVGEIGLAWKNRDMDAEASAERVLRTWFSPESVRGDPPTPTLPHEVGGSNRRPHQIQRPGRLATSCGIWCAATAPDVAIILAAWEAEIIYD